MSQRDQTWLDYHESLRHQALTLTLLRTALGLPREARYHADLRQRIQVLLRAEARLQELETVAAPDTLGGWLRDYTARQNP